jgi:hypothetical protein
MIAGALTGVLLIAAAQAAHPVNWPKSFEGRWNQSASGCNDDETSDIIISRSKIFCHENEDQIRSSTQVKDRSVDLTVRRNLADFDEPAKIVTAKVRLTLSQDAQALSFDAPDWLKWDLVRCPSHRLN